MYIGVHVCAVCVVRVHMRAHTVGACVVCCVCVCVCVSCPLAINP